MHTFGSHSEPTSKSPIPSSEWPDQGDLSIGFWETALSPALLEGTPSMDTASVSAPFLAVADAAVVQAS